MDRINSIWINLKSLGLTILLLIVIVPVFLAIMWLAPIIVILTIGATIFIVIRFMNTEVT